MTLNTLEENLQKLAIKKTHSFCYACYQRVEISDFCPTCGTDDFMREMPRVGVEYGTDWVISALLEENLTPVDLSEALEEQIRDCYGDTVKVAWMELDIITILKEYETDWRCALSDMESNYVDDQLIWSPNNGVTYYWVHDIEKYLAEND